MLWPPDLRLICAGYLTVSLWLDKSSDVLVKSAFEKSQTYFAMVKLLVASEWLWRAGPMRVL
jgi:hypothetical protein